MSTLTHSGIAPEPDEETEPTSVDLDITGMSCASCAARITKKLNKVDGVQATVNYATSKAHVLTTGPVSVHDLIEVVEAAGYGAALPEPAAPSEDHAASGSRSRSPFRSCSGAVPASIERHGRICDTVPLRWTPSSAWGRWPLWDGRCGAWCGATPARSACDTT